jgi:GrpB-like predicted nucleotidyltransferase (UPF0157 family)
VGYLLLLLRRLNAGGPASPRVFAVVTAVNERRQQYLTAMVLSGSGPVEVLDYDPSWATRFLDYAARIQRVLGAVTVRVEHIGSTAVPGLAAKPVIDVQVSVPEVAELGLYKEALELLGFLHRPHPENDEAREFFRPPGPRVVHVHVVGAGSVEERRYLLHRDFLRAHPSVASEYGALKRRLAGQLADARQEYQLAKDPFLKQMDRNANEWAVLTKWSPDPCRDKDVP